MSKKLKILIITSLVIISACSSSNISSTYTKLNKIIDSRNQGYESTIIVGTDSYYVEVDKDKNFHMIEKTASYNVEAYYINDRYYICKDKTCEDLTKENVSKLYPEFNVPTLSAEINSALEYHDKQYEYIKSTKNDTTKSSMVTDENGVITLQYDVEDNQRQLFVIDEKNQTFNYDFNTQNKENVKLVIKPENSIKLRTES